jgi:photosystem II stability/assembly factor-like uncharacterized protein
MKTLNTEHSEELLASEHQWRRTNAPMANSRTDDIWFLDANRGWAVNSNGHILHTGDGGATWVRQFSAGTGTYLRCVSFANDQQGWVGTVTASRRLFRTVNGGTTWTRVDNLPPEAPPAICGLSVVNERVIYAAGTNFPDQPTGVIKTVDGGASWTGIDMGAHATLLVDIFFLDERRGFVVGGKADVPNPGREHVIPVVLFTEDGGLTWENRLAGMEAELPRGEWGWKIQFLSETVGFVSLENFDDGAILKTSDGGRTWTRIVINDPQNNANLEGIGFVDENLGWVGGWGDRQGVGGFTSETRDGGQTWTDANHVGNRINRFRFIREPELVGYASGRTVYKYSAAANAAVAGFIETLDEGEDEDIISSRLPVKIPVNSQYSAGAVQVDIWDRFGEHVATLLEESASREITWSGETESGKKAAGGFYIYRVTIDDSDDSVESRSLLIEE